MITYEFHLFVKWYYEPKITIDEVPYDRKFRKYDAYTRRCYIQTQKRTDIRKMGKYGNMFNKSNAVLI